MERDRRGFFYLIFYTGFCSSIVEEMVFRGYLVKLSENRWDRRKGMILPGLLFGLVHSFPFGTSYLYGQLFFYLSISILFTVMTYRSGSIWDSVLVHAFWDIFVVRNIVFSIDHQENTESFFSYVLTGNVPNPILELSMTQRYVLYSIAFLVLAGMVQMFFCPRRQKQTEFKSLGKS
ncbi:MAG: CPBP family intramembrane metalloprotease [Lachnospiraceae bacterium]|nr:CPBP family intramembrane metalloprotease [Lachnospiraceae bacterium]